MTRPFDEYRTAYEQLCSSGAADLLLQHLRDAGVENPTIPSFEEVLASGVLPLSELRVTAMTMVNPDWLTQSE